MQKKAMMIVIVGVLIVAAFAARHFTNAVDSPQSDDRLKMGAFIYSGDDTFIAAMMGSLREMAARNEEQDDPVYLTVVDAKGSQSTQNGQIERYLSLGYHVLCVNIVDRTSAVYIIDKAMDANVPVVFFNREPVPADLAKWDKLFYVGTDPAVNGRLEGQIVVDAYRANPEKLDKNGDGILQYIMIEGEFRHQDAVLRTENSIKAIHDAGIAVEKIGGGIANWDRAQAAALAKEYFETYGDQIELIICNNDDMALGVIDIVEDMGLDFTNIVGIDGTPQGLEAVANAKMLGTIVIDYQGQAQLIFDIAYALATGEDPAEIVDLQLGPGNSIRAPMYAVTPAQGHALIDGFD